MPEPWKSSVINPIRLGSKCFLRKFALMRPPEFPCKKMTTGIFSLTRGL